MSGPDGTGGEVESAVAEWVANLAERVRAGESVDVDALAFEHPERAEVLRRLLPSIEAMARHARSSAGQRPRPSFPGGRQTLGEYQFVREIGRGGMGVVYEATQSHLNRSVALKVLPGAAAADPRQFERFQIEARAAACLQHAHIVPIYGVGCEDDVPYYVMQFIEGRSLAEILHALRKVEGLDLTDGGRPDSDPDALTSALAVALSRDLPDFPTPDTPPAGSSSGDQPATIPGLPVPTGTRSRSYPRAIAGLGLQAAEALDHAHENGVIHRDIKPGNLILDRRGHLWVTDFGLARVLGDAQLTLSGDLLGTLRYMSPEQALGRRGLVDGRSDVYSLGVTLYELLTLHPAFEGSDRAGVLHALARNEPTPLRLLNPAVPRDLETIVLKAMAKEPVDRYLAARDLADDLARFLDGRPIIARRPGLVDRTVKLACRNRPVVIAVTVLTALALLGVVVNLVWSNNWLRRHNEQLSLEKSRSKEFARIAETHQIDAEQQRDLADGRRRLSDQQLYDSRVRQAFDALERRQLERTQEILRDLGPESGADNPREFVWHYLWRRSRQDVVVLTSASERVFGLAVSNDGWTLATGDVDGTVRLRDSGTGALRATLSGDRFPITSLAFSPDDRLLASGSASPELFYWEVATGRRLAHFATAGSTLCGLQFEASGRFLWANSHHGSLDNPRESELWDLGNDVSHPRPRKLRNWPAWESLSVTPDGRLAAVRGPGKRVVVVDAKSETEYRTLPEASAGLATAAISPDGRRVAASEEGPRDLILWDVETARERARFAHVTPGNTIRLVFSGDSRLLAAFDDRGALATHDVVTGRVITYPSEASDRETSLATVLAFAPGSRRLAWSYPGAPKPVAIYDVETGQPLMRYPGRIERLGGVVFHPDGRSLFLQSREQVFRWITDPAPEPPQPAGHTDEAWAAAFSPDSRYLVTGSDDTDEPQTLKFWDAATGGFVRGWKPHDATVSALAFAPDGQTLATASLGPKDNLRLWDVASGRLRADLVGHGDRVRTVAFSADGRVLASAGSDRMIRLWDVATGTLLRPLEGHEDTVRQVAFQPRGELLASVGNDRTIRLWNASTGESLRAWDGAKKVAALAFAPDGLSLASADTDGVVSIRDVTTGEPVHVMHSDDEELTCLAFAPDGRTLASAGLGRVIHLWDPLTGQELASLKDHRAQINALAFSPDGAILASCSHDGVVRLWRGGRPLDAGLPRTR